MGRVLAVDPGSVRVGLAVSDPLRITAHPLEVVAADAAVERVAVLCDEMGVDEIVVGLPTTEGGAEGVSAEGARAMIRELEARTGLEVIPFDERYTSRMAESSMIEAGVRRRDRRTSVDKVAAAIILADYLESRRGTP